MEHNFDYKTVSNEEQALNEELFYNCIGNGNRMKVIETIFQT